MKKILNNFSEKSKATKGLTLLEESDHIGSLYRKIRNNLSMSQKSFGQIININRETVRQIEKGKRDLRFQEVLELSRYNDSFGVGAIAFLESIKQANNNE